jgi:hypothetical protein
MTTKSIEFIGSLTELLDKSQNEDPTKTKCDVFQLPNTPQLQERYVMTFCGPEARAIAAQMTTLLDMLASARMREAA